ncbi:MAG: hypothetical protein GY815_09485 [Gammaproteobacteria bacterium]|nr:hypothetical protein [Gammaproteobacteria bacterium]
MSDQLFEVAFSGQISEGASTDEVRARIGKMFNADEAKLAQLFSGRRVVIKKNIDQATADKYRTALNRAGAECEVAAMGGGAAASQAAAATPAADTPASAAAPTAQYETNYNGEVPPPPQIDPLGITGDDIEDLAATIAPVGSELQDDYREPEEPDIDVTGLDIAPVGSDLYTSEKKPDPPPPDTTGITMAD